MTRSIALLGALGSLLLLSGCPDSAPPNDNPPATATACAESPTELPRPPTASLPCELLPPNYKP